MKRRLNRFAPLALVVLLAMLTVGCGRRQAYGCRVDQIEDAELLELERGEVEMTCGNRVVDVSWSQFRRKLNLDPGQYKDDLRSFDQQFNCIYEPDRNNELLCQRGRNGKFETLPFTDDD
ncbi:hypothetical protein [Baaleninema sp.]|uniref:hypothetical protein n=1 Tax=Baaleninema sp. TaxID=3101197 RepID=UPI003CFFADF7